MCDVGESLQQSYLLKNEIYFGKTIANFTKTEVNSGSTRVSAVDWREEDCVTPVQWQGACSSCCSIAAVSRIVTLICVVQWAVNHFFNQPLWAVTSYFVFHGRGGVTTRFVGFQKKTWLWI